MTQKHLFDCVRIVRIVRIVLNTLKHAKKHAKTR
jgi:hypothetical protein